MNKKKITKKAITNGLILIILGAFIWIVATYIKFYNVENVRLWMGLGIVAVVFWIGTFIGLFVDYKFIERLKK